MEDARPVRERYRISHGRRGVGSRSELPLIRLLVALARYLHVQRLRDVAADVARKHDVSLIRLPPVELGYRQEQRRQRDGVHQRRRGLPRHFARDLHHDAVLPALQVSEHVDGRDGIGLAAASGLAHERAVARLGNISYVPHSPVSMYSVCPTSFVRDTNMNLTVHSPAVLEADSVVEGDRLAARR